MCSCLLISLGGTQAAADTPKVIALVQSAGCGIDALQPAVRRLAAALAENETTSRVVIDWPSNVENLDPNGRPSPFLAAIELVSSKSAVPHQIKEIASAIPAPCVVDLYIVRERQMRTYDRSWPVGEPSPGAKLISTVIRKSGLSMEQFDAHWAGPHAAIALANPVKTWRYVQNTVVSRAGNSPPDVDGIAELHYRDPDALKTRMQVAPVESMRGIEDARTFMDLDKGQSFMAKEIIMKDVGGRHE